MIPEIYPRKLPQAILFDWDQTLVDNWRVIHKSINITRKALGLSELSSDEYWSRPHQSTRDAGEDLFGKQFEEGERLFYASVEKVHLLDLKSLEGADPLSRHNKLAAIFIRQLSGTHSPTSSSPSPQSLPPPRKESTAMILKKGERCAMEKGPSQCRTLPRFSRLPDSAG